MTEDSRVDTHEHIAQVRGLLLGTVEDLVERAHRHDRSKLSDPELEIFNEYTPLLRATTYGSDEYKGYLEEMGVALRHHYAANDHHPEHFAAGIQGMNLIQLLEMICDWIAATRRHADGDITRSIEQNAERFGYGAEIKQLLLNTAPVLSALEYK